MIVNVMVFLRTACMVICGSLFLVGCREPHRSYRSSELLGRWSVVTDGAVRNAEELPGVVFRRGQSGAFVSTSGNEYLPFVWDLEDGDLLTIHAVDEEGARSLIYRGGLKWDMAGNLKLATPWKVRGTSAFSPLSVVELRPLAPDKPDQ